MCGCCYASDATAFDGWICRVDGIRVGADLRVRCSTARRVTLCRDARLVSSERASVPEPAVTFDTTGLCQKSLPNGRRKSENLASFGVYF